MSIAIDPVLVFYGILSSRDSELLQVFEISGFISSFLGITISKVVTCQIIIMCFSMNLVFNTKHSSIMEGRGDGTVVGASVCQADNPGSRPPRSAYHRRVRFYHCVIHSFPPVPTTGSKKAVHVLCLCNNACKRSLAICRKSRASCPVSWLLSVPI